MLAFFGRGAAHSAHVQPAGFRSGKKKKKKILYPILCESKSIASNMRYIRAE